MISARRPIRPSPIVPFLALVAIAFALFGGYLIGNDRQLIMMAVFGGIPLLLLSLRSFTSMVMAIPFAALFITSSLPTGTESRIAVVMLLVMMLSAIWLVSVVTSGRSALVRSSLNKPLFAFMAICCLSLVWSIVFRDPLLIQFKRFTYVQLASLATLVLSPLATLLIGNFVRTPRQIQWIVGLFVCAGLLSIAAYFGGFDLGYVNTRGLFPLWFAAIVYAATIGEHRLAWLLRLALFALLLTYAYIIGFVNITWLSGWVPPLIAIVAITLLRSRLAALALVIVLALCIWSSWDFFDTNVIQHSAHEGDFERVTLLELNLELVQDHPLLGTGPAGYALYYVTYHPLEARSTHNGYLDLVSQTGLLGTACWLWIVVAGWREGRAILIHAPPGLHRTVAIASLGGLIGALAGMVLGDWVLPFAYNQGVEGYRYTVFSWIFLGLLISIRHQIAPNTGSQADAT